VSRERGFPKDGKVEWTLLELLCFPASSVQRREEFVSLVKSHELEWANLVSNAIAHKLFGGLALALSSLQLSGCVPGHLYKYAQNFLYLNKEKNAVFARAATEVSRALGAKRIEHAFTKGLTAEVDIFRPNGEREMGDLDIAIAFENRSEAIAAMEELGFMSGLPVIEGSEFFIRPFDRRMQIIYSMAPDHIPHFTRPTGLASCPAVVVDFSHDMLWYGNPFGFSLSDCFGAGLRSFPCFEKQLPSFSLEVQFLWTILHLFRDAWLLTTMHFEKDVMLSKFRDVIYYWQAYGESLRSSQLKKLIRLGNIEAPVSWVLSHTDATFGTRIVSELEFERRPSQQFLHSACIDRGRTIVKWEGSMKDRIRSPNRKAMFDFSRPQSWNPDCWAE
jgi:hypothetical protein